MQPTIPQAPRRTTPVAPRRSRDSRPKGKIFQSIISATNAQKQPTSFTLSEDDTDWSAGFDNNVFHLQTAVASGAAVLPEAGVYIFSKVDKSWFHVEYSRTARETLSPQVRTDSKPTATSLDSTILDRRTKSNPTTLRIMSSSMRRDAVSKSMVRALDICIKSKQNTTQ